MDVVSTEDDGRDISWYTEMVRTLPHALSNEKTGVSARARKYPVIISWTWSFLVGQSIGLHARALLKKMCR